MPKDLERRHRGPVSRAGTAYIRTRAVAACQVCRARRVKCDNERPCSNCRRIGATCSSEPVATTAGFDPASLAILAKLEELQSELAILPSRMTQLPGSTGNTVSQHNSPHDTLRLDRHLQRGNLDQVLEWDVWHPHTPRYNHLADDRNAESSFVQSRSDQVLDMARWNGYVDSFFHNVHVLNPVLDEQRIRSQLINILLNGIGWDVASCLLLLVLANGAASSPLGSAKNPVDHQEQHWASARALFAAAEKRKDLLWRSDYLTQARCHFYSGVFMMVSMRPFDAWRHFLQGLATCQRLTTPLHSTRTPDLSSPSHAEESIYWSCWKSERELRFELDVPDFGAAGYDHPILYPTLPSEISDQEHLRAWYFYLAEISLWRSEMTARQTMGEHVKQDSSNLDSLAEQIVDLELSLASWQASLPETLRLDAESENPTSSDVLLFVLKGRLTYNYEVLTWPFLETLILFGPHTSPNAAALAARGVSLHHERLMINRPGFYHQHHGTRLMQRSSTRSACVLLAIAKSTSSDLLPAGWQVLVSDTISMLEHWRTSPQNEIVDFLKSVFMQVTQ